MKRKRTPKDIGLMYGFRSGLEEQVAHQLQTAGVPFEYESIKFHYTKPARNSKYSPDFILPNGIVVETKGRFVVEDRQKHLILRDQHPELDIRLVFSNSKTKISKGSKTSYADWCIKYGFVYSDKLIPQGWLKEPPCTRRLAAIEGATKQ